MPMTETFAERLRRLRIERGWSQRDMARATGLCNVSISQWETCHCAPAIDRFRTLSEVFGVTLDYLITGREHPAHAALLAAVKRAGTRDTHLLALIDRGMASWPPR